MACLLSSEIISIQPAFRKFSLPGLLAAMARGEVEGFPALRPHQRPAWHMFLCQLSALALDRAGRSDLPVSEDEWSSLLLGLTDLDPAPWTLVGPEDRPAFMQPPAPPGLSWSRVETPDALDLLITARNHDLKVQVARQAADEDWVFALVSLQTCEGYGGAGNHGIARMNGGSSSRAMLALAPGKGVIPHPSRWWRRDVLRLLQLRSEGEEKAPGRAGGPALLWCLPWPEGQQLALTDLDPWFIEVCRRVRLDEAEGTISARRTTSKAARIDAKNRRGVVGDPWAPVSVEADPKALTLGEGDFDYRRLCDLLFSEKWSPPPLARPVTGEGDCLLVAEALSRGNSKTDGFKSRILLVPEKAHRLFGTKTPGMLATEQIKKIKIFDEALRNAIALLAARGDRSAVKKDHYTRSQEARYRFDRAVDAIFFPALWDRLVAEETHDAEAGEEEQREFIRMLYARARRELEAALPATPCPAIHRPRAEVRARRAFHARLRRESDLVFLFEKAPGDESVFV